MSEELNARVETFVLDVAEALGIDVDVALESTPDGLRVDLEGEAGEALLRRKGEPLEALQQIASMAFRREFDDQRLVIDCLGFRKGKDRELKQMAQFLIEKARSTGMPQEIGPLNSYARRLVHVEVADAGDVISESLGEGSMKIVRISTK